MEVMEEPEKAKPPTVSALEVRQTLVMPTLSDSNKQPTHDKIREGVLTAENHAINSLK